MRVNTAGLEEDSPNHSAGKVSGVRCAIETCLQMNPPSVSTAA